MNQDYTADQQKDSKTITSHCEFEDLWQHFLAYTRKHVPGFVVDHENYSVLASVVAYFFRHQSQCQKNNLQIKKGLILIGPVGCGKSTLMRLFAKGRFQIHATRDISRRYSTEGMQVLERFGANSFVHKPTGHGAILQFDQPITYCFDDLGIEQTAKWYGNECNVMTEILLDRYDQFCRHGMITHMTTNMNALELESIYGDRVRSRLREMCNLISFSELAADRRK